MKKNFTIKISVIISIIIMLGFVSTGLINYNTYSKVIKSDIENISKLSSMTIFSEINNELIKPIFVSLTMANDSFLKDWIYTEDSTDLSEYKLSKLKEYLIGIKLKYNYNSIFVVSETSGTYYNFEGTLKTLNKGDTVDQWYYDFINSNKKYELNVDLDEADNNEMTIFVNCRIEDNLGNLLGVAGVGLKMNQVQKILSNLEDNYQVEAFLFSPDGIIQAHTTNEYIETINIFKDPIVSGYKESITSNLVDLQSFVYNENSMDGYIITRYIDELGWYLMVKKDTSVLKKSFTRQLYGDSFILILVLISFIFIATRLLDRYRRQISYMAKTDQLTGLPNRRGFDEALNFALKDYEHNDNAFNVLVFDIDNFKDINDKNGHLFGDHVITKIGIIAKEHLEEFGMVARWGGDEFSGIIFSEFTLARELILSLMGKIRDDSELVGLGLTISLGLTKAKKIDTRDTIIFRADKGLYQSKNNGKNQYYIT